MRTVLAVLLVIGSILLVFLLARILLQTQVLHLARHHRTRHLGHLHALVTHRGGTAEAPPNEPRARSHIVTLIRTCVLDNDRRREARDP